MIVLEGIGRDFDTPAGARYCAVDGISLEIASGAFCAIVGPSGCGKTTLLNLIAGLLAPSRGRVAIDAVDLAGLNARATYLFQQDALLPWKNVRENVALGLTLAGAPRRDALGRADEWLARVGLQAFGDHFPAQLSGGMRKRAAMAQHWILDRDIVLMDEPFSALDVHTRNRMESELLGLWEGSGKTVVFVTHDLEEAIALADEVVVLSAGPASRNVSAHRIDLERPRDLFELRTAPAFLDLYASIWADLRDEVRRSQKA
ncbi:MAG TPA: ABC transporter ATP-binding protein [Vicinamibacterales bacterium]|nr:ABC transporter ATP-binding protein [Vicinamibacterales bacterium]